MREEIIFDFIQELSMAMYGKVMYFKNDDGTYFSRVSGKTFNNLGLVEDEILGIIRSDYE